MGCRSRSGLYNDQAGKSRPSGHHHRRLRDIRLRVQGSVWYDLDFELWTMGKGWCESSGGCFHLEKCHYEASGGW